MYPAIPRHGIIFKIAGSRGIIFFAKIFQNIIQWDFFKGIVFKGIYFKVFKGFFEIHSQLFFAYNLS